MFYYDYYSLIILMPLLILSFIIQGNLNARYKKYSRIDNTRHTSGMEIAKRILTSAGVYGVSVEMTTGVMTDRFDPTKNVIYLSESVYNGTSIAAIGIAAHETGHALQFAAEYTPMRIRSAIVGVTNFSSKILYLLIILSFVASLPILSDIAVICFLVIFFFQLITLPVEFNASRRAVENIESMGYDDSDLSGVKKILFAAAMTYVAAMLVSLGQMISYMLRTRRR